jgi:predicted RND superfamily exporter protein
VVLCVAAAVTATRLKVQNPRGLWSVSPDPPAHQYWTFAQQQFGDRDVLLVGVALPAAAASALETTAVALQHWIRDQPEVAQVLGIEQVQAVQRRLGPFGGRLLSGLREAVIGRDGTTAMTYVILRPPTTVGSLDVQASFVDRLRGEAPGLLPTGYELHVAGQPAIDVSLDRLLRDDFARTVPLALAALGLVLVLLIGREGVAAVVAMAAGIVVLLAGLALTHVPVSSATAVALPLTVVVGISYAAHVGLAVARADGDRAAVKEIRIPLTWSYVTTVVAVGSFVLSPIRALRFFAAASAAGLSIAFLSALSLTPLVRLRGSRSGARRARRRLTRLGVAIYRAAARRQRVTVGIWLGVMIVISVGVLRLRLESNSYLGFFPEDHPIARAYRAVDAAFGGSVPLHVLARVDSGSAFQQERARSRIAEFLRSAAEQLDLGPVLQPPPPRTLGSDEHTQDLMARWFQGEDVRYTRAIFTIPIMSTPEAVRTINSLDSLAREHSDEAVSLSVTGLLPASIPMQQMLVGLMIRSLALLGAFVFVAFVLAARSLRGGLTLLAPNLIAVLAVVGVMGYVGIPIDFTTVSVTSLVLGVAVDDTLQLTWAGREAAGGRQYLASRAVRRTAAPVLLGSIAMIVGAATLTASQFPPTSQLGGLLALGLAVALAADLTLTPLLIARWAGRHRVAPR